MLAWFAPEPSPGDDDGHDRKQPQPKRSIAVVGDQLIEGSIYRLLAEQGAALFGDEYFADLFKRSSLGRPTVPRGWWPRSGLVNLFEVQWE